MNDTIKKVPLGVENYAEACSYYYVDKTLILKDIIDSCLGRPLLITRPRRFGKSLMVSMIDYYFSLKKDSKIYFENKKIFKQDKKYLNYLNSYPVIHINMKNISAITYDSMMKMTLDLIASIFRTFREVLDVDTLFKIEKEKYLKIANLECDDLYEYIESIKFLSDLLYKKYNKKVVILIDEYDTPLENAYQKGFYDDAIEFFKRFYSATLKANDNVLFSLTTGVLQISKESIFSELNNLNVFSNIDDAFMEYFGFTKDEVIDMANHFKFEINIEEIESYYAGYGNQRIDIFNPWSILCYIQNSALGAYWINSGSNTTIANIIKNVPDSIEKLNSFVNNEKQCFKFNNSISYNDVKNNFETLCSFLVQSGYLVAKRINNTSDFNLYIPNLEITEVFEREIIARNLNDDQINLAIDLRKSIKEGNVSHISSILSNYVISSYSYYDLNKEKDYQTMILGILAVLFGDFLVKSEVVNKNGRCDIMLLPKNNKDIGIVIELKHYKGRLGTKRLELYSNKALIQIKDNKYYDELVKFGCKKSLIYSFVFDDCDNAIKVEEIVS